MSEWQPLVQFSSTDVFTVLLCGTLLLQFSGAVPRIASRLYYSPAVCDLSLLFATTPPGVTSVTLNGAPAALLHFVPRSFGITPVHISLLCASNIHV